MAKYQTVIKCWICHQYNTTESPPGSVWSSPCPCELKAHESCLLDWIEHLQSNSALDTRRASEVICPCCQTNIRFTQPHRVLGELFLAVERAVYFGALPSMGFLVLCLLLAGCYAHGSFSLYLMFGTNQQNLRDSTKQFLSAFILPATAVLRTDYQVTNPVLWFVSLVGLYLGRSEIASGPVTPIKGGLLILGLRQVYRGLYLMIVSGKERQWRTAVAKFLQTYRETPPAGSLFSLNSRHTTPNVVSLEINVLTAFIMPPFFGVMGDFLGLLMPANFTVDLCDVNDGPIALLQSRGGRSIIGGCVFVCAKDAFVLCCVWCFTRAQRSSKIFDQKQ